MRTKQLRLALATLLLAVLFAAPGVAQGTLSAELGITSDYVFRGISKSDEDPAVSGGLRYQAGNGFYAGLWDSTIDFDGNPRWLGTDADSPEWEDVDLELQTFIGFRRSFATDWAWDVQAKRYLLHEFGIDRFDNDYNEYSLGLSWRDLVSAGVAYSNDVFNMDGDGIYYSLAGAFPLENDFAVEASVGYYDLDDVFDESYTDWSLGVSKGYRGFDFDLAYHDTSSGAETIFGEISDSRVVLSVTRVFHIVGFDGADGADGAD